jgi:NAD-dependent SIR2 family protein deacetylase
MKPVKTLDDVSDLLRNEAVKNIVVVAGAGISTPSGIPDFRYYNALLIHTSSISQDKNENRRYKSYRFLTTKKRD